MAINSYISNTGQALWKASTNVRSKTDPSVRVQKTRFGLSSEKEARKEELRLLRESEREISVRENQGLLWGEAVDRWVEFISKEDSTFLANSTRLDYIAALRKYTESWWHRPSNEINRADVREILNQMKAHGRSRKHQAKIRSLIHQVFVFGVENRLIKRLEVIPTLGLKVDKSNDEKKPEILTISEIRRLLFEARKFQSQWYHHWALALLTGMRSGELYALQWDDIDWENKMISINKSYSGRFKEIKSTKAGYWRSVPISSELEALLKELRPITGATKNVLPRLWQWSKGAQAQELRKFCVGLNLPSIRFHTLRACFATQLIRNGVPPIQVMKIGGWRDLKTMQIYIRMAGIEIHGATESLRVLPEQEIMAKVVSIFKPHGE